MDLTGMANISLAIDINIIEYKQTTLIKAQYMKSNMYNLQLHIQN